MTLRSTVLEIRQRKRKELAELDDMKVKLNSLMNEVNPSVEIVKEIDKLGSTIYQLEEQTEQKLMLMAGIKWREEGERSSKFFLNQTKVRSQQSASPVFINEHDEVLTDREDILSHGKDFYSKLYSASKNSAHDDQAFYNNCPKLNDRDASVLDNPLTISELEETLKGCRDSCPGLDGIPYSYYKMYSDLLLPITLDSWNYGLVTGTLAPSHTRSCITIIPKAGKDSRFIKNWRPITVSACDIKIITKTLALRMAKAMNEIISTNQMAYVPGRDINFNNRILSYIIDNSDFFSLYSILSFDAEKAFDSVDHEYIRNALREESNKAVL